MRLGIPGYLIHGTNRPAGVGMRVTHGCVRMFPEDIDFLFGHIDVNTKVRIINEPVKIGWHGDELIMEVHPVLRVEMLLAESDVQPDDDVDTVARDPLTMVTEQFITATGERAGKLDLVPGRRDRRALGWYSRRRRAKHKKRRGKRGA
jgi:hypothetical protein